MQEVYLVVKTKNAFAKVNDMRTHMVLTYYLKNIVINGVKKGCSGFIRNEKTGVCVYIITEQIFMQPKYMYRYADNIKDYRGYRNRWVANFDDLVYNSLHLLASSPQAERDIR